MLDPNLQQQLKKHLEHLQHPVEFIAELDGSKDAEEINTLIQEIAALSPLIAIRHATPEHPSPFLPAFSLAKAAQTARIRFAGLPLGHEFSSLVLALLQTGGHPPKVRPEQIEIIQALTDHYHFEVFISLSCHNCPDLVQALNTLAVLNPCIQTTIIDGAKFPEAVEQRKIMAVPSVYLNGEPFAQGRMSLEEIIEKLNPKIAPQRAKQSPAQEIFDVLVVGGGPAGIAAAIYAARKGIRTGILAERLGGQVLDTQAIENFISIPISSGAQLARGLEQHLAAYNIDPIKQQSATRLIPGRQGTPATIQTHDGTKLRAKTVIIATGARWREINVPGEREYRGHGVAYCPHCDGPLFKGKKVAVIGGGNSGVEAAIDLAGIVAHLTLIEYDEQLRADAVLQQKLVSLPNVTIITHAQTTAINGENGQVKSLSYLQRQNNTQQQLPLDGIFVQIGLQPNTDWLKGTLALSAHGEIEVDSHGQTSIPGIFAAGDVSTVPYKQIVIALGEGAKAALSAFENLIRRPTLET